MEIKLKILQVNCVYKNGSTGKIVADLHSEFKASGYASTVVYGRGRKESDPDSHRISNDLLGKANNAYSRVTGILYGGCFFETKRLIALIKREKPDIVHLHCINGFFVNIYELLKWLGKNGIKVVLTLHAEFMYTGSCGYALGCNAWRESGCNNCPQWRAETRSVFGDRTAEAWERMRAAFSCFKDENIRIVAVSPWLEQRSRQSLILKGFRHSTVFNGIDTAVFCKRYAKRSVYPEAEGKYVIFHATANFTSDRDNLKGGYHLLKLAEKMKDSPVHFYVAGKHESGIKAPPNVTLLGRIDDQKRLAEYYSSADVTVLLSRQETFSMICAESLCCGTPIVGFYAGAPETISIPEYSTFVEYGDTDAMQRAITDMLERHPSKAEIEHRAKQIYSKQRMLSDYCRIYEELITDGRA